MRRFTDEPVAEADLHRIPEAGRWTGSARNRRPWRVAVVRDTGAHPPWRVRTGVALGHPAPAPPAPGTGRPAIPTGRRTLSEVRIDP